MTFKSRSSWADARVNLSIEYVELMEVQYLAIRAAVRCKTCDAERGRDCRTKSGHPSMVPHVSRKEDWRNLICDRYGAILHF